MCITFGLRDSCAVRSKYSVPWMFMLRECWVYSLSQLILMCILFLVSDRTFDQWYHQSRWEPSDRPILGPFCQSKVQLEQRDASCVRLWTNPFLACVGPRECFKTVSPTLFPKTKTVFQSRNSTDLPDWGDGKCAGQPLQHRVIRGGRYEVGHCCGAKWVR